VVKLNAFRDGTRNASQLALHRLRADRRQTVVRRLTDTAPLLVSDFSTVVGID
jgi:hypothetical protein